MLIDSTTTLCLGNFLRQKLKAALERYDVVASELPLDFLAGVSAGYSANVPEVAVLQNLVGFYDPSTSAHAQRLVQLTSATGGHLDLSEEEMYQLNLAALLHDIGKIGIPASILEKPGPLNEEEWRIMRLHPEIGQRILLAAGGIFANLAPIVLAHHERWDGCGYPNGLVGEEIPLLARILAVVDSYDAMVSHRAYSVPISIAEARAELQCCAGSQYDPLVVAAFLAVLDEQDEQVTTCSSAVVLFAFTAQDLLQHAVNPLRDVLPAPSTTKKLAQDNLRQNLVEDVPELAGEEFATPSLQSAEYAPLSA